MEIKNKLLSDFLNTPITVGEEIQVLGEKLGNTNSDAEKKRLNWCKVIKIQGDNLLIYNETNRQEHLISKLDVRKRLKENHVGSNPFKPILCNIHNKNFDIENILSALGLYNDCYKIKEFEGIKIKGCQFNPFVFNKNREKIYYQRELVWTIDDKQRLIESIYNNIACGAIVIRKRPWEFLEQSASLGETDLSLSDVVDGKQRLNAIYEFINDKFVDSFGNYYSDLSNYAQRVFLSSMAFSYQEMDEKSTDIDVITQFLKTNFTGKPQSIEHINYVKNILTNL